MNNSRVSLMKSLLLTVVSATVVMGLGEALTFGAQSSASSTPGETHSAAEVVGALHAAFGQHHVRAVHAKGVIFDGEFTPDAHAKDITKAAHLQGSPSKVTVRFSDFTGLPDIPDNSAMANPRGMAIKFRMANGVTTDLVTHSFNGFPVSNTDDFRALFLAVSKSGPDAAKPTELDQFLGTHPIAKTFLTTQKTPASYATIGYFGVNSFKFTNAKGQSHFIRYQIVPESGEELLTDAQKEKAGASYLVDEIKTRVAKAPIAFKMFAQLSGHGDKIDDPSVAWPETRERVLLGRITIDKLAANTAEEDKGLFFIPNNLPAGIETADPMLDFRSKAYPISVNERQ